MQVSSFFKEFVAYYVEGAVFNGDMISRQKYLQRYCALEGCEYENLLENLSLLIDALNEYKEKKSKVLLKVAQYQVRFCYLPENFIEDFSDKLLSWENESATYSCYMKHRGGDIFDDMPGGHNLKQEKPRYFIFDEYAEDAKLTPEMNTIINSYKKQFGIKKGSVIEEHPFYKDYLSKFNFKWDIVTPEDADFICPKDWDLLARLIFASLSTSYSLVLDDEWKKAPTGIAKVHLCITASHEEREITKMLDELWSFQIMSLFRTFINEQIQLVMIPKTESEFENLQNDRESQIEKFKKEVTKMTDSIKEALEGFVL